MISKARAIDEPARKQHMIQAIANFMKMAYVTWNKDTVADETIIKDLRDMSNGDLQLQENVNLNRVEFRAPAPVNRQRSNTNQNKNRNTNRNQGSNRPQRSNNSGKRY